MALTSRRNTTRQGSELLEQVVRVFAEHIDAKPHYLVGSALWMLHTYIYTQYDKSPRLAILSPVQDCGKSTVMDILGALVWQPHRTVDITPSSLFRLAGKHTLLLDEVDNMSVVKSMRAILNDGHSVNGTKTLTETVDGVRQAVTYPLYGPVALASIGKLPVSVMSRSLVIRLHRADKQMQKFRPGNIYLPELLDWKEQAVLNPDPFVPPQLIGRNADKWRPLLAIAELLDRAMLGYETAANFLKEGTMPDIKESVLRDSEKVFDKLKKKWITTEELYRTLLDDKEGEYEVDYVEYKLTKTKISHILTDFEISNKPHRYSNVVARSWFRDDFEEMWKRYA
jgi:hypothetical protein